MLAAEVVDLVLGLVFGGEDEGQAVLDLVEVDGGHHDALEGVLGGEDDVLFALAVFVEGDVGDLLVLAVDAVGVFGDGVDFDGLAVGVIFAGLLEGGLALAEFLDDLVGGDAGGRGGVEGAEAGGVLRGGAVWNCDSGEGWGRTSPIADIGRVQTGSRWRRCELEREGFMGENSNLRLGGDSCCVALRAAARGTTLELHLTKNRRDLGRFGDVGRNEGDGQACRTALAGVRWWEWSHRISVVARIFACRSRCGAATPRTADGGGACGLCAAGHAAPGRWGRA